LGYKELLGYKVHKGHRDQLVRKVLWDLKG